MSAVRAPVTEDNEAVVYRMLEILARADFEALREVLHPDFVQEMPQSGERVRGIENAIAIGKNYPGGPAATDQDLSTVHVLAERPRYVMTPTFQVVKVEGSGDTFTVWTSARWPDGSLWYAISVFTMKEGKIAKDVSFFAPVFPAPEWRAQWVEPMEP